MAKTKSEMQNLIRTRPIQVIAVSSGKGGVGKSNIALNLAVGLAQKNKKVLLFDADLGLPSIDIMLDLRSQYNLSHVLKGVCPLNKIILNGPYGLHVIPGAADADFTGLTPAQHAGIIDAFNQLTDDWNYLIIDTSAGISDAVLSFTRSVQEVIVVICDDPASLTGAYTFMKAMNKGCHVRHFHILANMMRKIEEGERLFSKLQDMSEQFLDISLNYLGAIPFDEHVYRATKKQKPVVMTFPESPAAKALFKLTAMIDEWPLKLTISGNTSFFLERMVG